ncbi:hypothetical protein TNCV_1001481 [Trichonephila clavipes]|nr:hypothetical protein TNCV_1001481 [Trichonephila clavipes]
MSHYPATRGLLETNLVSLNHGQVMETTLETGFSSRRCKGQPVNLLRSKKRKKERLLRIITKNKQICVKRLSNTKVIDGMLPETELTKKGLGFELRTGHLKKKPQRI